MTPAQDAATSHHASFPNHHADSSEVEAWMRHECCSGMGATASSQTGRRCTEEEQSGQIHSMRDESGYPSNLDSTLQHIVRQLDILTQVSFY